MQRDTQTPSTTPKRPVKQPTDDATKHGCAPEESGPFATFTEWSNEADEKAYASL
jgi:hypothetical protein